MSLKGKNAVIYGAAGAIGSAVAHTFAREGATVFLAGRTLAALDKVAEEITSAGGIVETAQVDALDEQSIKEHIAAVGAKAGGVDISFNAIGIEDVQGIPLTEMSLEDFSRPITLATRTQFLTAKAVAPQMMKKGAGVIMMITATPARMAFPLVGGFGVACAAMEGLSRGLAAELGPHGVRVNCLRSAGSPESIMDTMDDQAAGNKISRDEFVAFLTDMTLLKRLPTLGDVGEVAAFIASDRASAMTGAVVNVTCGTIVD